MTTDDPHATDNLDEKSVRDELTRAFDICGGCRRCLEHCSVFPGLFDLIDAAGGGGAGLLTPVEQDALVDRCFHCQACLADCPYAPDRDELQLDLPKLMLRATAMRRSTGQLTARRRRSTAVLGRTRLLTATPLAGAVSRAEVGGIVRRIVRSLYGIDASRPLPPRADRPFRSWFLRGGPRPSEAGDRRVTVVPTCLVDRSAPHIGVDLVRVLERNGVDCALGDVSCCGAPWLLGGDIDRFGKVVDDHVRTLAEHVADGRDVVVPQPSCADVVRRAHVDHAHPELRSGAEEVARHTFAASAYLMHLHRTDGIDTAFRGPVPPSITHVVGGRARMAGTGETDVDLLRLTGADVEVVEADSADEVMWGRRVDNTGVAEEAARRLGVRIAAAGGDVVTGGDVLTNLTIEERTGRRPLHPVEVIARAYGVDEPPADRR